MINIDKDIVQLFENNGLNLLMFTPNMEVILPSIVYEEISNTTIHRDKSTGLEYSKIRYDFTITTLEENSNDIYEISDLIDDIMHSIGFRKLDASRIDSHNEVCDRELSYGAVICSDGYVYDYSSTI